MRSRRTWSARASRRTGCTPKARARPSRLPATRPPKAARRIVAWRSKWSERAESKALRSIKKPRDAGLFVVGWVASRHDDDCQRRPPRAGQVQRAGASLVGHGKRLPAVASDQPAAPRLD